MPYFDATEHILGGGVNPENIQQHLSKKSDDTFPI